MKIRGLSAAGACLATAIAFGATALADRNPTATTPEPVRVQRTQHMNVYEWGTETARWDGGTEHNIPFSVPDFYHNAADIKHSQPAEVRPQPPQPPPRPPGPPDPQRPAARKPVVYFDTDRPVSFNVNVTFAHGKVTWVYPKPTHMLDDSRAQWVNLRYTPGDAPPQGFSLNRVDPDHWGFYSREGSKGFVTHGRECERFLFYEGENRSLRELDVHRNADGDIVLVNHSAHVVHDIRYIAPNGDTPDAWQIARLGAGRSTVLRDSNRTSWRDFALAGTLADETMRAGLTAEQSKVFERAWHDLFFRHTESTLSYRRDAKALDEIMTLNVAGSGLRVSMHRVGYVYVHGIDLERVPEMDRLAEEALSGSRDATEELRRKGMAGEGALRRIINDSRNPAVFRNAAKTMLEGFQNE